MAGKFETFNSLVEEFNKKHGVNFSFERYETKVKQTEHMRSFFTGGGGLSAADFSYRTVARELFRESVESMIAKKVNSVDHTDFLNDFDKLMDNYREYCTQTGDPAPGKNGGWGNNSEMIDDMQGKINDIPDDKSDFIKNSYIKRSLRLRDMRADLESMEKDGKSATAEELSRAIVYKRALEKTIKERSFGWRAIHWFQGPAEKRDLELINKFIAKYEKEDFYTKANEFADEKAVGAVKSKLEAAREEIKAKELLRPRRLKDVNLAEERLRNQKVNAHVSKQAAICLEESLLDDNNKNIIAGTIVNIGMDAMRKMWGEFEKATTVEAKENAIIKHMQALFNETHRWLVNGVKFNDETKEHDRIVASQRITNLMLKQYSPATSESTYDKFCDNYLISDKNFMDGFMRSNFSINKLNENQLEDIMKELKDDIDGKRKIRISDKDMATKNVGTSKKNSSAPAIESRAKTH